jgi:hypothetical protein
MPVGVPSFRGGGGGGGAIPRPGRRGSLSERLGRLAGREDELPRLIYGDPACTPSRCQACARRVLTGIASADLNAGLKRLAACAFR